MIDGRVRELCEQISALQAQIQTAEIELRAKLDISNATLEQCEDILEVLPTCATTFKVVDRIMALGYVRDAKTKTLEPIA